MNNFGLWHSQNWEWDYKRKNTSKKDNQKKKKEKKWNYQFQYLTYNVGKGFKLLICLYEKDSDRNIINIDLNRKSIEIKLLEHNRNHYRKVLSTNAFKDKIYSKL